ncbi:MAG TPA: adenylate/guanylate cyclase domain-containing protein, partial [Cyanobacteria bacterium UBA11372]|nr:adenylate/guanylate cyclase domain-containing protein [Cyanobacteria bacterium UBA11372]
VAGLVMTAGCLGIFQLMEWATLDQFFRWRPRESTDPRITIVTIDESDITHVGQWPIPDAVLAKLIQNLHKHNPKAIGLDLYRDLPVEPGHQALVEVFKNIPNLIGVEKAVGNAVPPPPILKQLDRVGLADLVLDADGKVRRGLISVRTGEGQTKLGLGTTLALMYLQSEGMTLKMLDAQKKHLGLGKAVFMPLMGNEGGYVRANTGGYQILLNYRGTLENFEHLSMKDILENRIPPNSLRDRIILIGATGASLNDLFFTPYSTKANGSPQRTPGVVIHANITSQIISAAIEGRPFIRVWQEPIEWLWILVWSFAGAGVSSIVLDSKRLSHRLALSATVFLIGLLLGGAMLVGGSYVAFLASWWLPVIAPLIAFTGSGIAIAGFHTLELQQQKADLEILLETTTEHADALATDLEHKAEEAIRESERKLAQFLEAVPVGVAVADASGKLYYFNQAAQQMLGKGVVPDATAEQMAEIYQTYIAGTNQLYPIEKLPMVRALRGENSSVEDIEIHQQDKIIPIEVWGTPIYDRDGKVNFAIVVFRDITERKKAESDRIKLTNDLIQLNVAYSRFVPRQFLQLLNKESIIDVQLGDQVQQEMSVLFSDIRDFTTLSETMTPEENFKFINAYLSRMEPAILENNGFIDKYIGDAIMALFSGSADDAVKAGIAMLQRLAEFNTNRGRMGRPRIKIGIGINTGSMMLGTVGGHSRMDGTAISDAVNLASRLEGLTKNYGVALLISEKTFLTLNNPADYAIRLIDRVKVKGKSEQVIVYEVFDADPPEVKEGKLFTQAVFKQAIVLYNLGILSEAAQLFSHCLHLNPGDKVARIYLERCQQQESIEALKPNG